MEPIQENTLKDAVITHENGKVNIVLDASKLDMFLLCEARYNYRYNLKRALPVHQKSRSLDSGSIAHMGLEVYYNKLKEGLHYNDRMQACLLAMRVATADPALSALDPEEAAIVMKATEESCDYWRADDEMLEILAVETPFAYVLWEDDTVRIIISGKIDLLVNQPALGRNAGYTGLPKDHKTNSRSFEAPRLSNQFMNYCVATNSHYIEINKIGLQTSLPAEAKYLRPVYSYDDPILEDWKQNTARIIMGRYLECIGTNEWNMNFTSCLKFNRLCEYYEVCDSSGQEAKDFKLSGNYVEAEEWDVTKGLIND